MNYGLKIKVLIVYETVQVCNQLLLRRGVVSQKALDFINNAT